MESNVVTNWLVVTIESLLRVIRGFNPDPFEWKKPTVKEIACYKPQVSYEKCASSTYSLLSGCTMISQYLIPLHLERIITILLIAISSTFNHQLIYPHRNSGYFVHLRFNLYFGIAIVMFLLMLVSCTPPLWSHPLTYNPSSTPTRTSVGLLEEFL